MTCSNPIFYCSWYSSFASRTMTWDDGDDGAESGSFAAADVASTMFGTDECHHMTVHCFCLVPLTFHAHNSLKDTVEVVDCSFDSISSVHLAVAVDLATSIADGSLAAISVELVYAPCFSELFHLDNLICWSAVAFEVSDNCLN